MCKQCDHILAHPADRHRGTSTMNRHFLQAATCQKRKTKTHDIRKMISNGVRKIAVYINKSPQRRESFIGL
ncbi:uncharacterized protein N7498_001636 [Penicillium cinerascens]|uniref:Uncharacterized protein n=1 Tax=Penicillium cinerascens TaxID=70096 RepID=A0A9W9NA79_9EURO|nr:uncharacterized protein N7498_001636 [Penicillium cinerascens]KAJ5215229.1 hypothetical protein N7498_001636 [Penicillium cinerascens]